MGADMLLAGLPAAEITEDRKRRLCEIIGGLSDEELATNLLDQMPEFEDEPEELREAALRHVELLENAVDSREVAALRLPFMPYTLLFTGGPSWGDFPTSLFETFVALAEIEPVFAQLEIWAQEDAGSDPLAQKCRQSAIAVLKEFAEDIRVAYGTGTGAEIDENRLDWPDLAATYRRALEVLDAGGQGNPGEEADP